MSADLDLPTLVIGAGVVGLAIARVLAHDGRDVWVLEAASRIGTGVSSRNSEVVHAGIHYPPGSLKARTCVRGKELLYAYAASAAVPHRRTGKLVVATTDDQVATLRAIQANATASGVDDLALIDASEARRREPEVACVAALWSPSSGIVDGHALMQQLEADVVRAGGTVLLDTAVDRIEASGARPRVQTAGGAVEAAHVFVAAGLASLALARTCLPADVVPKAPSHLAKGTYFSLVGFPSPFRHLVYPVPEPGGLGIHATVDLAGRVRFGPDVEWVDTLDYAPRDHRRAVFEVAVRRYWPGLPDAALVASYTGIRPKLVGPGMPSADFRVLTPADHGVRGITALLGIESPGLTASLALAELATGVSWDR
ncbi:MAG: NAD(P)/FAD-dependent oxidoreductase [Myxococcota bacterium]